MNRASLNRAFHEVNENIPEIVEHTERKYGSERANKQKIAIALSKARKGYAEGGPVLGGGGMLAMRKRYQLYAEDEQSEGNAPLPFAEWLQEQQGGDDSGGTLATELPEVRTLEQPREPILDTIMNALRSFKFAGGGQVASGLKALPDILHLLMARLRATTDPLQRESLERQIRDAKAMASQRGVRGFANGGRIHPELFESGYYESDMIPGGTAQLAAEMAQERALQAASRDSTSDGRANLAYLKSLIARLRAGAPAGETGEPGMPDVGSRRELLQRMLQGGEATPRYAAGGGVRHVNPGVNGFTHLVDDVYTFADGGGIPAGPPMGPGQPPMAPPMPGGDHFDQNVGALGQLGRQLLAERTALQSAYQIPPPPGQQPPGPQGGPGGMPPQGGPGGMPPGMPPGPQGGPGTVQQGLQQRLVPQFKRGGPVSSRVYAMAARDPRLAAKMCKCGGGRV